MAVALGFSWLNINSELENLAVEQADFPLTTNLGNSSIEAIPVSRDPAGPNQLQTVYSKPMKPVGSMGISTTDSFIGVDDYCYQRDNSESIDVGEVKNADDTSYQRDDNEVINVGEIMDVEILDSTY